MKVTGLMVCAAVALGANSAEAWAPAAAIQSTTAQPRVTVQSRSHQKASRTSATVTRAQPSASSGAPLEEEFEYVESETAPEQESTNMFALGGLLTAALAGTYAAAKKYNSPAANSEETKPLMQSNSAVNTNTLLNVGKWMTQTKKSHPEFVAMAFAGKKATPPPSKDSGRYSDLGEAVQDGLVQGVAPFPEGIDAFSFFKDISKDEAKRYADVEITHGRICMLAALGFLVGEQVEGSSFLFDANVTGPAINHFQQVPAPFWGGLGALIFVVEASRVQIAWQNPFDAEKLFLLKQDFTPGDYGFDPLNLAKGKDDEWLNNMKLKELNNGRVAMVAISGMVAQELVNGLNLLPADEVLEMGGSIELMEKTCAGDINEAACAKAFEAALAAAQ